MVGAGPGSFTGLRVALAAAHGMAIGWGAELRAFSTLALLAASEPGDDPVVAALAGGHGELFVQSFARRPFAATSAALNLPPASVAAESAVPRVVGNAAKALVAARGWGEAIDIWPSARHALRLPPAMRDSAPAPVYLRLPDARPRAA